ncbi:hypothetical protein AX16_000129 [Volvariella volvacea WC 439]|nr:hypothetical protein AX16_000129 [Volvariella volvacea WC 439]
MLSSPAPSHTASRVLHNRTNALPTPAKRHSQSPAKSYKRPATEAEVGRRKRAKVSDEEERGDLIEHSEDSDFEEERDSEDDTCTSPPNTTQSISCRRSYLNTRGTAASTHRLGATEVCTRPILQSFVSSHKSDVFRCTANAAGLDLTPPYACSFSYGAKRGGDAVLAVATEEGSVHILNTNPRSDWDYEPQRTTLQPHENGVFGIKWSPTDALLATCSGDQSTRITHVKKEQITHILRGHTSTVKCIAWEPGRDDLLATGGRDGTICLWDLRLASSQETEDAPVVDPVLTILGAHESVKIVGKPRPRRRKSVPAPKSITNLLYPEANPYALISSSSFDG